MKTPSQIAVIAALGLLAAITLPIFSRRTSRNEEAGASLSSELPEDEAASTPQTPEASSPLASGAIAPAAAAESEAEAEAEAALEDSQQAEALVQGQSNSKQAVMEDNRRRYSNDQRRRSSERVSKSYSKKRPAFVEMQSGTSGEADSDAPKAESLADTQDGQWPMPGRMPMPMQYMPCPANRACVLCPPGTYDAGTCQPTPQQCAHNGIVGEMLENVDHCPGGRFDMHQPRPAMYPPNPGMYAPNPGMYAPNPGMYAPNPGMFGPNPGMFPPHPGMMDMDGDGVPDMFDRDRGTGMIHDGAANMGMGAYGYPPSPWR